MNSFCAIATLCLLFHVQPGSSTRVPAAFVSCPVLPVRMGARPRQSRRAWPLSPSAVISQVDDYLEIKDTACFFVRAFWEQSTAIEGGLQLSEAQRAALEQVQEGDMSERYGKLVGKRKLMSELFVSRGDDGMVEACAGVEVAVADRTTGQVLKRNKGEELLTGSLAAMSARERNTLRRVSLTELADAVLPSNLGLVPVLSNLAVGSEARGQGLGQQMVQQCEDAAKSWGFGEMLLLVEASNVAAVSLYKKLGYQDVWTQPVQAARVAEDGAANIVSYEMVETCALGKVL
mmetsp:Transcript_232/g.522  ORF Transcript_232/g.522 Transcript_232/m.522 type:complete len:290 (+) Transcript_232:162-1031(+)|eukprot:CAMPEP_0172023472 /NCGR_PEP_ID=MMETSP1041-20130122/14809_1 /TAXON_ID=464988 /ORGANISM="Hemiselmis andersenii, Strain CCMP439" /LENGTH=289 /DNA_ID=CAMNT_0012678957 /DNA_START=88 /DNA_END=957 /DNA_ORIENTATION=-